MYFILCSFLTHCPSAKNSTIVLETKLDVMHSVRRGEVTGHARSRKKREEREKSEIKDMKAD